MYRLGALAIGYLLGGIQTAILYGRLKGVDIRQQGSGNAGTTNTIRILGKKAGAIVLLSDILKAFVAIIISKFLWPLEPPVLVGLYAGIGAILGHSYPMFFGFKGGKGIATTVGMMLGIDYRIFLIAAVIFLICFAVTKIVSISSLLLTASFAIMMIVTTSGKAHGMEASILAILVMAVTFYRHKSNIKRLIDGTESKLISKK